MIWNNPFLIKNSEQISSDTEFLSLFDSSVLQMIPEENFCKISNVISTPGAGKTSLFKAFSPNILKILCNDNRADFYDLYSRLSNIGVLVDNEPRLLSATISCARGYNIIDEMFNNGRRKQTLFALLNYRILLVFLRNICTLLNIKTSELKRITFKIVPEEMISEETAFINGFTAYEWAKKGEQSLCDYLDDVDDELPEQLSFVHTSLVALKLIEYDNILFDDNLFLDHTLLIFDDFHKLTKNQKAAIHEILLLLKTKTGVWLGQRLEGLSSVDIISLDGSINRDYNQDIYIDGYWRKNKQSSFHTMLENIANKRVREANITGLGSFSECFQDINTNEYEKVLIEYSNSIINTINNNSEQREKYSDVIQYIYNLSDTFDRTLYCECIKILNNRDKEGQMKFYLGEKYSIKELKEFVTSNKESAIYYVCSNCNIPFYYGLNKVKCLSSYNIEQFLSFSSNLFDVYTTKIAGVRNADSSIKLTPFEQEKCIKNVATEKWNDIDLRFSDSTIIKCFLNNIAHLGQASKAAEKASYSGGAYTGIGIPTKELNILLDNPDYEKVIDVISKCLSSKYLEKLEINIKSDKPITVFYLNRWLCVYYGLPLAYGGWKQCSINKVVSLINSVDEQLSIL